MSNFAALQDLKKSLAAKFGVSSVSKLKYHDSYNITQPLETGKFSFLSSFEDWDYGVFFESSWSKRHLVEEFFPQLYCEGPHTAFSSLTETLSVDGHKVAPKVSPEKKSPSKVSWRSSKDNLKTSGSASLVHFDEGETPLRGFHRTNSVSSQIEFEPPLPHLPLTSIK